MPGTPDYTYYGVIPFNNDGELDIYDGDTVKLCIDLGMDQWSAPIYYRLLGIQAPEIRPLATREAATAAREHLRRLVTTYQVWHNQPHEFPGEGMGLIVKTHKKLRKRGDYRPRAVKGKYGRFLVELIGKKGKTPVNINQFMIEDDFAVPYLP